MSRKVLSYLTLPIVYRISTGCFDIWGQKDAEESDRFSIV